jgi:uncharacterized protein YjiS (DUF1127 family)
MEVAMNDTIAPHRAALPGTPVWPVSCRRYGLATLRNVMAIWDKRKRFRRDLAQMSRDDPHLIDDIGLTRRQAEAEIAKPFWRA